MKAKPHGPVPAGYVADEQGVLRIGGMSALALADHGTPQFVYDLALVAARVRALRQAMPPDVAIHYAIKANSHPDLLAAMAGMVDGFDVASGGELHMAVAAGMAPQRISFAGPGKRNDELTAGIRAGATVNVESEGEAERALHIGQTLDLRAQLAVRVNPDFELKGSGMRMGGGAKPFGVDAERVPDLIRRIVAEGGDYRGLHIFAGSQALDADALIEAQANTLALAARLSQAAGVAPPHLNLGGGFGVPYFAGDAPLDASRIGAALGEALAARPAILGATHMAIELGRYLVAEAGVYLTRVVDRKQSHGETFLIVDGGLHHQLAASGNFGTVIRRNYPIAIAGRFADEPDEIVHVVGCLCTPLDRLGDAVELPRADVGDVVAIFLAGAYGASASPTAFLGHPPAMERVIGIAG